MLALPRLRQAHSPHSLIEIRVREIVRPLRECRVEGREAGSSAAIMKRLPEEETPNRQ